MADIMIQKDAQLIKVLTAQVNNERIESNILEDANSAIME